MRPAPARDRLHAAIVALALCSTSVSIAVAGQSEDPQSGYDASAALAEQADPEQLEARSPGGRQAASSGGEATVAMRSFTDMIAEAAREQERLASTLPSQAQDCVETVDAAVSAEAGPTGGRENRDTPRVHGSPAGLHTVGYRAVEYRPAAHQPADACGGPGMATAL